MTAGAALYSKSIIREQTHAVASLWTVAIGKAGWQLNIF